MNARVALTISPRLCGGMRGGHANCDSFRSIDQKIRNACRQDSRFLVLAVVILLKVHGVAVDVREHRLGGPGQSHLGVAHGRSHVAIERPEISLTVHQWQAHGEILRQANQGVIDRLIAMRVVAPDHVTDNPGRFPIGAVPEVPAFQHRVEDSPVRGLEPVAQIGYRTTHDHAHRVVEIAAAHLPYDGDGRWRIRLPEVGSRCFVLRQLWLSV